MPFYQQVRFTHSHSISKWHPGSAKQKWFEMLKISFIKFMKTRTLDYLWSSNCINVCISGYNCRQTGIESSKRVYLASIGIKIEHIVGVQNQDFFFQNAYLMVMPAEILATTKVKIAKIYAFVRWNLMIYMENKYNWILLQILSHLSFWETSRHNHRYPICYVLGDG